MELQRPLTFLGLVEHPRPHGPALEEWIAEKQVSPPGHDQLQVFRSFMSRLSGSSGFRGRGQSHDLAVTRRCQKLENRCDENNNRTGLWAGAGHGQSRPPCGSGPTIMYWTGLQLNCSGSSCSAVPRSRTLRFSEHPIYSIMPCPQNLRR